MSTARLGIRVLVIAMDADGAAPTVRMLDQLGYDVQACEPSALAARCCGQAPDAIVVAAIEQQASAVADALREVRQLQHQGKLPGFPIVAAGLPDRSDAQELVDGIVLEPERLISLATELSKQVAGEPETPPVPPSETSNEEDE